MEATKPFLISFAKVSNFLETCNVFDIFLYCLKLILMLDTFVYIYTLLYINIQGSQQTKNHRSSSSLLHVNQRTSSVHYKWNEENS